MTDLMKVRLSLIERVQRVLMANHWHIATAESCTGGLLASTITSISGSSDVFGTGIVAYSNETKKKVLGVSSISLAEFGAVSEAVALEMVLGVQKLAQSQIAISTTGIAGPTGDENKPIGLIYLGFAVDEAVWVEKIQLSGNRIEIQNQTVIFALQTLLNKIE